MITLAELNSMAREIFPEQAVTLPCILTAWAQTDPEKQLSNILSDTGINTEQMKNAVFPFVNAPDTEDKDLLTCIIMDVKDGTVFGWHILKSLCDAPGHRITRALVEAGLNISALRKALAQGKPQPVPSVLNRYLTPETVGENYLLCYGRDLTALAKEGVFDDLCERENDMERLTNVLLKKKKGNGILTGAAGVGKTALVELLAKKIADATVPDPLKNIRVFEISMGKLLAGTMYRGQFEERLERVLNAVKQCSPAVLFIDEIHLIWGAGRAEGAAIDAANMLKPVLARGEVRMIGATTAEEYHQYIRRDEALSRRFEEIRLSEPDGELLIRMVEKQVLLLQEHHGISIPEPLILKAIELTNRYLPNRRQPDKSVDLLDSGSVLAKIKGKSRLDQEDLLETIARQTRQPVSGLNDKDRGFLKDLPERLNKRIIGQAQAVQKVFRTLIYRRQDLGAADRNLGTFLFAGSSGVGKTECGRILAEEFYGSKAKLLHLDLAEYSSPDSVNKLIGAPAGFVGSEKEGSLTCFLHLHSGGVILLDEIEKAHSSIHQLLLGMLDNGRIRSAKGEVLDTRQSIIIVTTNAICGKALNKERLGFAKTQNAPDPQELLSEHFPKEFLGRFDEIILFNDLSAKELRQILHLRIREAAERFAKKNIRLKFDENRLCDYLLDGLKKSKSGARGIARLLEQKLLQPLSLALLMRDEDSEEILVELDDDFYASETVKIGGKKSL